MRKNLTLLATLAFVAVISCQKEVKEINNETPGSKMSFVATMPEFNPDSKTTLGAGDVVNWASTDKIDVYGVNGGTVKKAVFALTAGDGTRSATFTYESGDDLDGSTDFYAIYPSGVALSTSDFASSKMKLTTAFSTSNMQTQTAVANGYDPRYAIMTAQLSAGVLSFRHGACYFGVQIPGDNITKVKISLSNNALQRKPAYTTSTGAVCESNSGDGIIAATGTFVKDSYYYIIGFPKHDGTKLGNLTVTFTQSGIEKPVTTAVIKDTAPAVGKIYDLGCPPILPTITAADVDILKTDTAGSIAFTVNDPVVGGALTAATTDGKSNTISNFALGAVGDGTIPFTCDANDGGTKYAYITLTYTYNTSKTVKKDIVITQEANVIVPHTYVFYVSGGSRIQKEDGVAGASYFTLGGSSNLTCSSSGYFGVDSFSILGSDYSQAMKIDGTNTFSFTTHAGVNSSIRFFAASRNSGTTARMQLKHGSTVDVDATALTWTDGKADLYDSGVVALTAETEYAITKKSNEQGLFYVVVTEELP